MEWITNTISLFHKGGPVMYILLLCSLAIVTIAAERWSFYRRQEGDLAGMLSALPALLEKQRFSEAQQLAERTGGAIGTVVSQGVRAQLRDSRVEAALEGAAMILAARLRQYLNYLSTIVTLSPLLGLLGTVIGMIDSFSVLNVKAGQPMAITGGVGEALVATAAGLIVATLALLTHTYLAHRVNLLVNDMEEVSVVMLQHLPRQKSLRRDSHEIA